MTVMDLMRADVVTAPPTASVDELVERMRQELVGSVVVTEDGSPVGIVTDRDVALAVVGDGETPDDLTADALMTPDPATVAVDAAVPGVFDAMLDASIRRLPVVDGGELVGIVTLDDLVVFLAEELGVLADVVGTEMTPY